MGLVEAASKGFQPMETASAAASRSIICSAVPGSLQIVAAKACDHAAIEQFLCARLRQVSSREFCHQLEEPWYVPGDRLLLKKHKQIIGHIGLHWRTMFFGRSQWTICRVGRLSLLPEFYSYGLAEELLRSAEQVMSQQHALFGVGDLEDLETFSDGLWMPCGEHVMSEADPRDILAEFRVRDESVQHRALLPDSRQRHEEISVRHWRQVELPALMRIYQSNAQSGFGYLERSEAYWRWLVNRHAFDQIMVVIEGHDRLGQEGRDYCIVGYAVVHAHQILEMLVQPGHPTASRRLVSRICSDAIERDWNSVSLHASFDEPIHAIITAANGPSPSNRALVRKRVMVCVPRHDVLVHYLGPELCQRAVAAEIAMPIEIGLAIDDCHYQLSLYGRRAKLTSGKIGENYLMCSRKTWVRLLLGSIDASSALLAEKLTASTSSARRYAEVLFPAVPLWHSPWADLPIG